MNKRLEGVPKEVKDSMDKIRYFCETFDRCDERCPFFGIEYNGACFFDQYPDPVDWRNKVDANS